MFRCRWSVLAGVAVVLGFHVGAALGGGLIRVPLDVPTIAEALDIIPEGGRIHVAGGVREGGFTIVQGVTIQGGFPEGFQGGSDPWNNPTWVTGTESTNAANADLGAGSFVELNGLVFTGGRIGLSARLSGDAFLNLDTITCQGNTRGMDLEVRDTAGVNANLVFLQDNVLDGEGAGLRAVVSGEGFVTFTAGQVARNLATGGGGGASVTVSGDAALGFNGTWFSANGYPSGSGDVGLPGTVRYDVADAAALFLAGATIAGNLPDVPGRAAVGGTQTAESLVQIDGTSFRAGSDGAGGEALDAQVAGISALRLIGNSFEGAGALTGPIVQWTLTEQGVGFILRNRFAGNASTTALVLSRQEGSAFLNFDGNVFEGNITAGEAISMDVAFSAAGALMRVVNNQVFANASTAGSGGGRFNIAGSNVGQIGYNTFVDNTSPAGVAGIHLIASDSSPAQAANNVCVGNLAGGQPADLQVDGFLGRSYGNFLTQDGDPGFVDRDGGNFRLNPDSVLINTADPRGFTIDHDFEQDPRPIYTQHDVGSDEFAPFGDINLDGSVDLDDYSSLADCYSGPDDGSFGFEPPSDECLAFFDADEDRDIDLVDFSAFLSAFTN